MLFNSVPFVIFFTIVFCLYWLVFDNNLKIQNIFLLISCYVFYGWWNWHFLILLILTSVLNFVLGYYMSKIEDLTKRRFLLNIGIVAAVGSLFYFKYVNFFIQSFVSLFAKFNIQLDIHTLNIFLPLGISFYTFRTLSYLFDINRGKLQPTDDWVTFFNYVAFFPSVISGPIDRGGTLIPQLEKKRVFNYDEIADGLRQILIGLFKKIVIADNCASFVNPIFDNYQHLPASSLIVSMFFYAFQMYADFSGYSDMAIGTARLLGFNITRNFAYPYFAQNIADFWRRWHMSLTSWLTDYIFTPASIRFRDLDKWGSIMAILVTFLVSGIWHGANWTFVLWGFLYGCYFIPLILRGKMNKKKDIPMNRRPTFKELLNIIGTFLLVMFTFVIFRSDSLNQAFGFYSRLFSKSIISLPQFDEKLKAIITTFFIIVLMLVEWRQRDKPHALKIEFIKKPVLRIAIYYTIVFCILFFGASKVTQFLYFKF